MTTKILSLVDALGNLVGFRLLPGQRHDICGIEPLIKDWEFGALLADKAFDADWLVKDLTERGSKVVIPPRSNRKALREYGEEMYKWRHLVENFFCKLKEFKKFAMRTEKTDSSFSANIYLAATHRLAVMSTAPSDIRTYLDSYERLFTSRGLFPSLIEEICKVFHLIYKIFMQMPKG